MLIKLLDIAAELSLSYLFLLFANHRVTDFQNFETATHCIHSPPILFRHIKSRRYITKNKFKTTIR